MGRQAGFEIQQDTENGMEVYTNHGIVFQTVALKSRIRIFLLAIKHNATTFNSFHKSIELYNSGRVIFLLIYGMNIKNTII
jgi:hypothetical protein